MAELGRFVAEQSVHHHGVRAVEPDQPDRHGLVERLAVDADATLRPGHELAARPALDARVQLGQAAFAEDPGREIRDAAVLAAGPEENAAVSQHLEELRVSDAWCVPEADRQLAANRARHYAFPSRGRKCEMSRIEPVRSAAGFQ